MADSRQPSQRAVDIIAITQNGGQVIEFARPMAAMVFEVSNLMEHPLEDGSTIADHIVFLPVEIDMPMVVTGSDLTQVFASLRQLYLAGSILTVQTRVGSYPSMVLLELPHAETPDMLDGITIAVKFRQAKFVKAAYGGLAPAQVKEPAKASTVKKGSQQTTPATAPAQAQAAKEYKGSTLYRLTR